MRMTFLVRYLALGALAQCGATPLHVATATTPAPVEVAATCAGMDITTSGWPDGTYGEFAINSDPPGGLTINTTQHWEPTNNRGYVWRVFIFHGGTDTLATTETGSVVC